MTGEPGNDEGGERRNDGGRERGNDDMKHHRHPLRRQGMALAIPHQEGRNFWESLKVLSLAGLWRNV